jgi:DNA-binding beta-propeller fold protein YncE
MTLARGTSWSTSKHATKSPSSTRARTGSFVACPYRTASTTSLYVDSPHRLAFVACDGNATLLSLNLRTMKFTGTFAVGDSPDVLAYDHTLRRLYVAAESGTVAVFAETAHGARRLGLAFLGNHAHTVAVDPRTHLVYFPLQSGSTGSPQLLVMKPT